MIKNRPRTIALATSLLALLAFGIWKSKPEAASLPQPADQAVAQKQTVSRNIMLVGKVEPLESVMLSAPFDGEVLQRKFDEGQYVQQGQVLVELSSADVEVRLREALAEKLRTAATLQKLQGWEKSAELSRANRALTNATQNVEDSSRRLEETSALYAKGIVAKMEVEALVQQQRAARSEQIAAQEEVAALSGPERLRQLHVATLEAANANDKYDAVIAMMKSKVVVAPFSGIAIKANSGGPDNQNDGARPGMRVAKGQALLGVTSIDHLRIGASVDEIEVRQLKAGQQVEIYGDAFGEATLKGEIATISSIPNQISAGNAPRYDIKVSMPPLVPDLKSKIRLGMSASLKIITSTTPDAVTVPMSAVYRENGQYFVHVIERSGGRVKKQQIQVVYTTAENAEVTGLDAGALIQTQQTVQ